MINKSSIKYLISGAAIALFVISMYYLVELKDKKSITWSFNEGWYETFDLANGMQVIVIPNHKVPAVSHMVWYKAGSMEDPKGKSGVAHFLEHLMFKGTQRYPDGEFSKLVAANGGRENAFTSHDYTAYFQNISKDKLDLVMKLEADRMRNLQLKDSQVAAERNVIIEERKMTLDNIPRRLLQEQMDAALYMNHSYGTQIIGWLEEIKNLTKEDALDYYRKYYAPNNAILVISGDVDPADIKKKAETYYGGIKPSVLPRRNNYSLPDQHIAKRIELADERVKQPEFIRQYIAPSQKYGATEQAFPLILLSKIMGDGTISRLYKSLVVDQKLAVYVSTYYDDLRRGPAEFVIHAIPSDVADMITLEQAINEEVQKIIDYGVLDDELESAKKAVIAEQIYNQEGVQALGYLAGEATAVGLDPDYITSWSDHINAVSAEEIKQAAADVLKTSGSVTGVLENE